MTLSSSGVSTPSILIVLAFDVYHSVDVVVFAYDRLFLSSFFSFSCSYLLFRATLTKPLSISVDPRFLSFSTPSSFRSIFSNICALSFPVFFPSLGLELVTLLIFLELVRVEPRTSVLSNFDEPGI
ncbi:hypothetical protein P9112_010033 [Eukaryota sp. TZLM1-RC]